MAPLGGHLRLHATRAELARRSERATGSWLFALEYRDEFRRSEIVIQAVDAFRRAHGRVPDSLQEAGLPLEQFDERCPCYQKQNEQSYIVSFGWTLGESVFYDSATGKWQY